jgi:hypothetical protein
VKCKIRIRRCTTKPGAAKVFELHVSADDGATWSFWTEVSKRATANGMVTGVEQGTLKPNVA